MTLPADVNHPEPQEVLVRNRKPVRSLVGNAISGAKFAPFWLWLVPICPLPPAGVGLVHSLLALLWYSFSPLFCEKAWQCLRSGLLQDSSVALSLSLFLSALSLWLSHSLGCYLMLAFRPSPYPKQCSLLLHVQPPLAGARCERLGYFSPGSCH